MSDPFALFAQDVKAAVPQSDPNQQASGAFPPHQVSPSAQPMQQPMSPVTHHPAPVPMNSPMQNQMQPPTPPVASPSANPFDAPVSPVQTPVNPYGAQTSPPAKGSPYGAPVAQPHSQVSPASVPNFPGPTSPPPGVAPPKAPPPTIPPMTSTQEIVPSQAPTNAWGIVEPQQQQPPAPMPQQQMVPFQAPADPWGVQQTQQPPAPQEPAADPFGVFTQQPPPPQQQAPAPAATSTQPEAVAPSSLPSAEDDMWAQMGFEAPSMPAVGEATVENGELPAGGEYYDVKIYTKTLGIIFFSAQQVKDSLYLESDPALVKALGNRPVVSHILEGSSARSANVSLGHVLLKVNGTEVYSADQAVRLIKESPRPLPLLFHVPDTKITTAEGEHMVKYDSCELKAPTTEYAWKKKYVVVGGIISKPYLINMYRSKEEYDVAVIETQSGCRKVSVKVKQFCLVGAKLYNDNQKKPELAMQSVKYKQKIYPWRYITILTQKHYPVKISATTPDELLPVYGGVRRALKEFGMFTAGARRLTSRPGVYTHEYDTGAHGYPRAEGEYSTATRTAPDTSRPYSYDHGVPGVPSY